MHRIRTIFYKSVQLLAYADDINIIGRTLRDVTAVFSAIDWESMSFEWMKTLLRDDYLMQWLVAIGRWDYRVPVGNITLKRP